MTDNKTESKVTKLSQSPAHFSEDDKSLSAETNTIKTDNISESCEITNEEDSNVENKKTMKDFILKTASNISGLSKKLFAATAKVAKGAANKLSHVFKSIHKKLGIKFYIASGLIAFSLVICSLTCSLGYKVTMNGKTIGILSSADAYNKIYEEINDNVFDMTGKTFDLPSDAKISLTIAPNNSFNSKEQFAENLKSVSTDMIPAYTIVIDGKMIVALPSEDMAVSAITEYKNAFSSGLKNASLEFENDVEICYMFAPKSLLYSKDSAVTFLLNGDFSYYKSDCDQTVNELSIKTGVSEGVIVKSNILDNNTIFKDQTIKLYSGNMFADVRAVADVKRKESIPFETVEHDSDEVYQGITRVETAGEEGVIAINERVTYVNGIEIKRDLINEKILKEPTNEVKLVGTKEPPPSVGSGMLVMPTSGSLSSRFGSRWGRQHKGIDVSAPSGTPIYAADNGIVTYSRFNDGGYGYMIQIDHGNSLETYYAHCSELLVGEGEVVAKGDLIAKVGNTGRSTGAHLHFEVRQDGTPIDPFSYLN